LEKALDLQASLLSKPLLSKDALHREIQAVNSEFEGHFSSDSVRGELIEKEHIKDKNHPIY
jgi:secreted Zn-dependent insulinase-like peptidase